MGRKSQLNEKVDVMSSAARRGGGDDTGQVEPLVMSLDVGTTTVRALVYDTKAHVCGSSRKQMQVTSPQVGWVEIDPDTLWSQVKDVIRGAILDASVTAKEITCLGITVQRNTFITWHRATQKPFHNFITWQDLRASDYVKSWNESYRMKMFNKSSWLVYLATRSTRFLVASVLRFMNSQVTMRLLWQLDHIPELRAHAKAGDVMFGTLDTWLLWKLTGEEVFATDYSCASSTAMYDLFQMDWSDILLSLVGIPRSILPPVKDTSGMFGHCHERLFGAQIPITAMVADQQGSMFGQCCFGVGDVKCTLGGGAFITCNTGRKPHASVAGLYPLIGWKIGTEVVYVAEGNGGDCGQMIDWAKSLGLFDHVNELTSIARSTPDSDGVSFVSAFSGLQAPVTDDKAATLLIGLTRSTSKSHVVRAILESLAFRLKILFDTMCQESPVSLSKLLRCDGGVSHNDFVMQLFSDLADCQLERSTDVDTTSLGVAFLAGLEAGVWSDMTQLTTLRGSYTSFMPCRATRVRYKSVITNWQRAVKRCRSWYS